MALFTVTDYDKKVYEEELRDFLPDKMIDIHTHIWLESLRPRKVLPGEVRRTVTWPDQKTFVCTVATLARTARENHVTKTALMLVGDSIAQGNYDRSKLYDPGFTTEFRQATK